MIASYFKLTQNRCIYSVTNSGLCLSYSYSVCFFFSLS